MPNVSSYSGTGPSVKAQPAFLRPGFQWDSADAYLFDIDGTLLNSRDAVHYFAFSNAMREQLGLELKIDGVPVHGNTDMGILRAVLLREGLSDAQIDRHMPEFVERMCREVTGNQENLRPELCPSIHELVSHLHSRGKLLGAASGNLAPIGWLKLEKAGLKEMFSFGSFCFPLELRAEIFQSGIEQSRQRLGSQATVTIFGDTPADIHAAHKVKASVVALATGTYSFHELLACSPDGCFSCGTDLLNPLSTATSKT